MKPFLNLIVAADINKCIGHSGPKPLQFNQEADMARFKALTTGNVVIMGRNTFESLQRTLPNRVNIVITKKSRDELAIAGDFHVVASLEEACELAKSAFPEKKAFLIGGALVYNEAIEKNLVSRYYITVIKTALEGDAIINFPDFSNTSVWEYEKCLPVDADEDNEFKSIFLDIRRS